MEKSLIRKIKYQDFVKEYPQKYKTALFYQTFLKLKKKGSNLSEIKSILGSNAPEWALRLWFHGSVPLPFKEFSEVKTEFTTEDMDYLATIIGHTLGDGGITKQKFLRYSNTEEFLIDEFRYATEQVFNANPTSYYRESSGIIRLTYPRLFSRVLLCLFGKFSLGKDSKKITPQIESMPMELKIRLMRAWYNDDGSVPDSERYKCVTFKQKDKKLILWVQKTLKELGIKSKLSKDEGCWHLRILNYLDMVKFRDKVGFSREYRKQLHLGQILKESKCPHWKTKLEILGSLKEIPKTRKEIVEQLNLEPGTIYGHLHGWKRKNVTKKSTLGLVKMNLVKVKKQGKKNIYFLNKGEYKKFNKTLNREKLFKN